MSTDSENTTNVRIVVHLRDGKTQNLYEPLDTGSGDAKDLKSLQKSLVSMQEKVNTFLTGLVEEERGTTPQANNVNNGADEEDEDDDEEEEDDDDDNNGTKEPPAKQQKR